jgi:hypothetical protein
MKALFSIAAKAVLLASLFVAPAAAAQRVTVESGDHDRSQVIVKALIEVPADQAGAKVVHLKRDGQTLVGQLTKPSLLANVPQDRPVNLRELHFIIPSLKSDEQPTYELVYGEPVTGKSFAWTDTEGKYADLKFGDQPVLRYMYERVDETSKERRADTFKVYHHVWNPAGTRLLTKGPGGLFPHHRGVFYGFNKISYGAGKTADTWHCNKGESQTHEGFVAEEAGPILGRHTVKIAWRGQDGKIFANELREISVYRQGEGITLEFASRLTSDVGEIKLAGDPQHAGFQFRASQDVPDKTAKLTYYLRPDGRGEPGKFRNWPADADHANLPWNALSIVLDDQRYTICYLDRPQNPKESRFSERDYGRFGSYFETTVDEGKPLELNYRLWIQPGEMTVEQVEAQSHNFVNPPPAETKGA